jgi:hypothetical protein
VLAGEELRARLDAALAREARAQGRTTLSWDERERAHVDAAVEAADAADILGRRIAVAADDPDTSHGDLVKLMAERRQQQSKLVELLRWLKLEHAWSASTDPQRQSAGRASGQSRRGIGRPGVA